MRKMIVTCRVSDFIRRIYGLQFFEIIESIELVRIIRLDLQKGTKLGVAKVTCKPGYTARDIAFPPGGKVVTIFHESDEESVLLFQGTAPSSVMHFSKMFPLDLIWTTPTRMTGECITYSVIGEEKHLKQMIRVTKLFLGEIEDISYEKATFGPYDLVQSLTKRQQEVLLLAKKAGYYQNPRKITIDDISEKTGLSRATVAEHLRKAENQIINAVLAGY